MDPGWQVFTMLFPARWFVQISRDTFLKGSGVLDLWVPFLALFVTGIILIYLSVGRFKRDLEP
jgi:ABC-2 type transport system permease protein